MLSFVLLTYHYVVDSAKKILCKPDTVYNNVMNNGNNNNYYYNNNNNNNIAISSKVYQLCSSLKLK